MSNVTYSGATREQEASFIPELKPLNVEKEISRIIKETDGLSPADRNNLLLAFNDVQYESDNWVATLQREADKLVRSGNVVNVSDDEVQGLIDDINKVGKPDPLSDEEEVEGRFDRDKVQTNINLNTRTDETQDALDKIASESEEQRKARESIASGVDTEVDIDTPSLSDFSNEEYVNEINSLSELFFDNQSTYNNQPVSPLDIQGIFADNFVQGVDWRSQLRDAFLQYRRTLDAAGADTGETEAERLEREAQENKDRADTVETVRDLTDDVIDSDNTPVEFTQEQVTGLLDELLNADPILKNLVDNNTISRSDIIFSFNDRVRLGAPWDATLRNVVNKLSLEAGYDKSQASIDPSQEVDVVESDDPERLAADGRTATDVRVGGTKEEPYELNSDNLRTEYDRLFKEYPELGDIPINVFNTRFADIYDADDSRNWVRQLNAFAVNEVDRVKREERKEDLDVQEADVKTDADIEDEIELDIDTENKINIEAKDEFTQELYDTELNRLANVYSSKGFNLDTDKGKVFDKFLELTDRAGENFDWELLLNQAVLSVIEDKEDVPQDVDAEEESVTADEDTGLGADDTFIDRAKSQLDDLPESDVEEEARAAGLLPPIADDEDVVIEGLDGDDIEPSGDESDLDEFAAEFITLVENIDLSNAETIKEIKATLDEVYNNYKTDLEDFAEAEAAINIVDRYLPTILEEILSASQSLFEADDAADDELNSKIDTILESMEVDRDDLLSKQINLINMRYDKAYEGLQRKGLIEGGGISASGANIRSGIELEEKRTQDLIQAEINLDEKLRLEAKETLTLLDSINRSRTTQAITEQQSRTETAQQLLDFVLDLESLRLGQREAAVGERGVAVDERQITLAEYRAQVDERLAEAELTGKLGEVETIALREMLSRVEIENRKLELENIALDANISIEERTAALNELSTIKNIELDAKKYNLEEVLGLQGLSLSERRLRLDEFLGEAGIEAEEREFVLNKMLGEGELAIRREQQDLEFARFNLTDFIERKNLLLAENQQKLEAGQINERQALEEQRLLLDQFIANNKVVLDQNAQRIDEKRLEYDQLSREEQLDWEKTLGLERLSLEGEQLDLEEKRILLQDLTANRSIDLDQKQLVLEEAIFNTEFDLSERQFFLEEFLSKSELSLRDQQIAQEMILSNARIRQDDERLDLEERQYTLEETLRVSDQLGFIINKDGIPVKTLKAKAQEDSSRLANQGLDLERQQLDATIDQFNKELQQQFRMFQANYGLSERELSNAQEEFSKRYELDAAELNLTIRTAFEQNILNIEELDIRRGELDLSKIQVENEAELALARLDADADALQAQITQQSLDRELDKLEAAGNLKLSYLEFEARRSEAERMDELALTEAANEYAISREKLALTRYQVDQDVLQRGLDRAQSARFWANEFGLDKRQVEQALDFAKDLHDEKLIALRQEYDMTEEEFNRFMSEYDNYEKSEARRDSIWAEVLDGNLLDTDKGKEKFAAIMSVMGMTAGGVGTGGSRDRGGGFFSGLGEAFFSGVGAGVGDVAREGVVDLYNSFLDNSSPDEGGAGAAKFATSTLPTFLKGVQSKLDSFLPGEGMGFWNKTVPYMAMAYASFKTVSHVKSLYDGSASKKWFKEGMMIPQKDITRMANAGLFAPEIYEEDMNFYSMWFDWSKGEIKYENVDGKTVHEEKIEDFVLRTNKVFLPIDAFAVQLGVSVDDMQENFGIMDNYSNEKSGREFNPTYVIISVDKNRPLQSSYDQYGDELTESNLNQFLDDKISTDPRLQEYDRMDLFNQFADKYNEDNIGNWAFQLDNFLMDEADKIAPSPDQTTSIRFVGSNIENNEYRNDFIIEGEQAAPYVSNMMDYDPNRRSFLDDMRDREKEGTLYIERVRDEEAYAQSREERMNRFVDDVMSDTSEDPSYLTSDEKSEEAIREGYVG